MRNLGDDEAPHKERLSQLNEALTQRGLGTIRNSHENHGRVIVDIEWLELILLHVPTCTETSSASSPVSDNSVVVFPRG